MTREENLKLNYDLCYLLSCAVNQAVPDADRASAMDLGLIYREAAKHLVGSAVAAALKSAGIASDSFTKYETRALRKAVIFDAERKEVLDLFEQNGIWYMPLKGVILKDYYPKFGMREMADNDIFVDPKRLDDVEKIMLSRGFREEHGGIVHTAYFKDPVLNFEIHQRLFLPDTDNVMYNYFADIEDRMIKAESGNYAYKLRDEDFYIYIICHEYKHYEGGGTGIRSLLDTYVYLKAKEKDLDWVYISKELEKIRMLGFEESNRSLSKHLFGGEDLTESDIEMFEYIISSGAYGTLENRVKNSIAKEGGGFAAKLKYVYHRLVIPMISVKNSFPFFYQHKALLPLLPFYRIYKGYTLRKSRFKTELNALVKYKDEEKNV